MACREQDIPNVGDHVVYEIVNDSFIVVRTSPTEIKAFVNACLHRGRRLRSEGGCVPNFRCPFHGFTWNIDGTFRENPSGWDFPQINPERFSLPQVRVGTWGGFVFINMDRNAPSLEEYLEDLPKHFTHRPLEDRYTSIHIQKVVRTNWKVAAEAFLESFHLVATHPQLLGSTANSNFFHDLSGWLMMPLALGVLALELWFLDRLFVSPQAVSPVPGTPPSPPVIVPLLPSARPGNTPTATEPAGYALPRPVQGQRLNFPGSETRR